MNYKGSLSLIEFSISSILILSLGWNPVIIWFNIECYIRFAVLEYEDKTVGSGPNTEWTNNKYRHLVNNSIGKTSEDFTKTFMVEEIDDVVKGYMWSLDKFKKVRSYIKIGICLLNSESLKFNFL